MSTRYRITVTPHGSLYVGGYAESRGASDGDTASDLGGILLPGSGVKGALSETARRLVAASGRGKEACQRLFGTESVADTPGDVEPPREVDAPIEVDTPREAETPGETPERNHFLLEGKIRIGPLRAFFPGDTESKAVPRPAEELLSTRHHVSLERATRQAAPQRLFQNQVTPAGRGLIFRGEIEVRGTLDAEEEDLLRTAARLTDQIGGGRGRGLGTAEIELETVEVPEAEKEEAEGGEQSWLRRLNLEPSEKEIFSLVLELEAVEPLQLGAVKDATNLATSKELIDGSALRGAVAASVTHAAPKSDVQDLLEDLLGSRRPVEFGDAYAGSRSAIPAPLTLWSAKAKKKNGEHQEPRDLAAHLAAPEGPYRIDDYRTAKGTWYRETSPEKEPHWQKQSLNRRVVTRTARNLSSGRAEDGKLYSLEIIDPVFERCEVGKDKKKERRLVPVRFYAPVRGTIDQLLWVVRAAKDGLVVGADRTRGFGRLCLREVVPGDPEMPLEERHRQWVEVARRAGVVAPESTGVFFALGPLVLSGERLRHALDELGLELVSGAARRRIHGGWNRRAGLPRGLSGSFVPGSTWIVRHRNGKVLEALQHLEEHGLGPGRADGWGRLAVCHEIHSDQFFETSEKEDTPCD